ncbi:VanZ family protein [Bacillus sp. DJP31]|uniref:VanZ family protein n=1 Tax=Bacillus sp. DJP31 TaxID=3409789 RepID=UPI003BB4B06A
MISIRRAVIVLCFFSYITFLFYLLFFSAYRSSVQGLIDYNLIPFKSIFAYISNFELFRVSMVTDNFFGNIAAFLPFGFLLPLLWRNISFTKIALYSFSFSLLIEISQFVFRVGAFDVDDMILNTVGGGFGYLMIALILTVIKRRKRNEHN